MEEEYVKSQSNNKTEDEQQEETKQQIDFLRGNPISYIFY
jgi:hypothetical protein